MRTTITPSFENYLKAIYLLQEENRVVRVKDLAKALDLKMATVAGGLKTLKSKGLVIHERYGHVELTQKGIMAAMEVYRRHQVLLKFFQEILGVNPAHAEEDACTIEHVISQVSLKRLIKLIDYFTSTPDDDRLKAFKEFVKKESDDENVPLSLFKAGQQGQVKKIEGSITLKRRLLDMGMVPGTIVKVEKVAPFGSPIILKVKGFHLSLRREELDLVIARPL